WGSSGRGPGESCPRSRWPWRPPSIRGSSRSGYHREAGRATSRRLGLGCITVARSGDPTITRLRSWDSASDRLHDEESVRRGRCTRAVEDEADLVDDAAEAQEILVP